jgi:threonine synthase
LAEQFEWKLPDVIIYPTGGGTGLIGMWKAFHELETLGWLDSPKPRMVAVQADGCAPVIKAFQKGLSFVISGSEHKRSLQVKGSKSFADQLIASILYESQGSAIAVSDQAITDSQIILAQLEGIFAAPEGAATLAGLEILIDQGWIDPDEKVVLFNTGTGLKYLKHGSNNIE